MSAAQVAQRSLINCTWAEFDRLCVELAQRLAFYPRTLKGVFGVPTGGSLVALKLSTITGLPLVGADELDYATTLVVDDLVDSGRTLTPYMERGFHVDALYRKSLSPSHIAPGAEEVDGWIAFPWEHASEPQDAVVRLLEYIGEDPTRDGLLDTPKRVLKSWRELTEGYSQDPKDILARTFDVPYDEMVLLRNIRFHSVCEHHMLPFTGTADVAYIPDPNGGKVVGLSKLARLVECFARRLQVQERMTQQIASAIDTHLAPLGVGVVLRAKHSCMGCRGVRKEGSEMITSSLLGVFRKPEVRAEFLGLTKGG